MAINTQKLLPASKSGGSLTKATKTNIKASNLLKGGALVKSTKAITRQSSSAITEQTQDNFDVIKVKVIELDSLLKGTLASQKRELDQQKKQDSIKGREKQEEKLETNPRMKMGSIKMPKLPRMGFLDWIKNYISNIILGYFAVRMVDYLPLLKPVIKFLGNATDFIIDNGGKLLDGLVTFIDWGYKAYDATGGFIKNLFGDDGVKQFNQLSSLLNKFLSLALIAGMVGAGSGGFGGRGGRGRGGGFGGGRGGRGRVTTSGGRALGRPSFRNPFRQRPRITSGGVAAAESRLMLPRAGARLVQSGEKRALLGGVRPFLKRLPIPIISTLIDFGLSVALGEDPGRAAFRAIGAGLLGAVGAAAGTVLPVAGNFIGGLVGGMAGDAIGGALYDMFFAGKIPAKGKTIKKAGGGITRGGKSQGKVQRTISRGKKGKIKRAIVPRKPGIIEINAPGSAVGGEDKLFGMFPNPFTAAKKLIDAVNPFKNVKDAATELGKSDYFGPILAISSKITAGQLPTQQDYQNVGLGINLLISQGIKQKQLKGGLAAAFAEGGLVDPDVLSAVETGGDVSNWVAKTFKGEVESNAQKTLRLIRENSEKKEQQQPGTTPTPDTGSAGGTAGQFSPTGLQGDIYKYLLSKGMSDVLALGIMANIHRESGFRPGVSESGGPGVGLFQYSSGGRKSAFLKAVPDYSTNWKGQIDYALKEDVGPQYTKMKFNSPQEAADWWMRRWERPREDIQNVSGPKIHAQYLAKLQKFKTQKGYEIPTSGSPGIALGKGYGSSGSKIAGELGRYLKKLGVVPGSISEHPDFGGVHPVHSKNSYHYQGRAIDLGGYAYEQGPILAAISQFNKMKGVKPVELLKAGDPGHSDHVHVAYEVGGETLPYPHLAMIGERGSEIVIDADSAGPAKDMLLAINQAKGYKGVMNAIQQYAPYDALAPQTIIVPLPPVPSDSSGSGDATGLGMLNAFTKEDPFESLYVGG